MSFVGQRRLLVVNTLGAQALEPAAREQLAAVLRSACVSSSNNVNCCHAWRAAIRINMNRSRRVLQLQDRLVAKVKLCNAAELIR